MNSTTESLNNINNIDMFITIKFYAMCLNFVFVFCIFIFRNDIEKYILNIKSDDNKIIFVSVGVFIWMLLFALGLPPK